MSWDKLKNCPECGRVFVAHVATVCPDCQKKIDEEYQRCVDFLRQRQNRMATLQQLSAGTGVSVKRITQFIREGRLSLAEHPNLGYPCDRCGALIREGRLCPDCLSSLANLRRELGQGTKRPADEEPSRLRAGYRGDWFKRE